MREILLRWIHNNSLVVFLRTRPKTAAIFIAAILIWIAGGFVFAEREKHIYVFPTASSAEGWDKHEYALFQDLSRDAELVDFLGENSASVTFGEPEVVGGATSSDVSLPVSAPLPLEEGASAAPSSADDTVVETPAEAPPQDPEVGATPTGSLDGVTPALVPVLTAPNEVAPEEPAAPEAQSFLGRTIRTALARLSPARLSAQESPETSAANDEAVVEFSPPIGSVGSVVPVISGAESATEEIPEGEQANDIAAPTLPEDGEAEVGSAGANDELLGESGTEDGDPALGSPVAVTSPVEPANVYETALCTTLGRSCHLLTLEGFGLGSAFHDRPITSARVSLSLSGRTSYAGEDPDRIVVRIFRAGRWEFLGEEELRGEVSNARRGGYLEFPLPEDLDWSDLSTMRIVIEYDRANDAPAGAYVDGAWLDIAYTEEDAANDLSLLSPNLRSELLARDADARRERRDTLVVPEEGTIAFTHGESYPDAVLTVKSDRAIYRALGRAEMFFSVTNESDHDEETTLEFLFKDGDARLDSLAVWSYGVEHRIASVRYDDIGYFCGEGWTPIEGEGAEEGASQCVESEEARVCSSFNEDRTNCIVEGKEVGLAEETIEKSAWVTAPFSEGGSADDDGIFARAIDALIADLPPEVIPSAYMPVAHTRESVLLAPGQTAYFRAEISVPMNSSGNLFALAKGAGGSFGLLRNEWAGSWNYQVPFSFPLEKAYEHEFAVPVPLDRLPESFWERTKSDGADIRFAPASGGEEYPYWLASWDPEGRKGLAWVGLHSDTSATATFAIYYGDTDASSLSDPSAPFRTSELTERAMIVGGGAGDMSLEIVALAERVEVSLGEDGVTKTLLLGESALFPSVHTGEVVFADGPIMGNLIAPEGRGAFVPLGFAGTAFAAPDPGGEHEIAFGIPRPDENTLSITSGGEATSLEIPEGTIVSMPLSAGTVATSSEKFITLIQGKDGGQRAALYPATLEPLIGFSIAQSYAAQTGGPGEYLFRCAGGARKDVDGRMPGVTTVLDICPMGEIDTAAPHVLEAANMPANLLTSGARSYHAGVPAYEFGDRYLIPESSHEAAILCPPHSPAFDIGVFDRHGARFASSTCEATGAYPARVRLLPPTGGLFEKGYMLRTLLPGSVFGAMISVAGGEEGVPAGQRMLRAIPLSRTIGPDASGIMVGEEAFVVPGVYRLLDRNEDGTEKEQADILLSDEREFTYLERPNFRFQYRTSSGALSRGVRTLLGAREFTVRSVSLHHETHGEIPVVYAVEYGEGTEWSLSLSDDYSSVHPGKYTMRIVIDEGGEEIVDEFDFFWGVLAVNFNKSLYTPGETAQISLASLSDSGHTICDADIRLWVTDPATIETEVPVARSGKCSGNNVVDVPDYAATYTTTATGTYQVRVVRLDAEGNLMNQISDAFTVRESVPLSVEREGPTRIYPLAKYAMKIRVTANEAFEGNIIERIPGDFTVIDRGNANLEWGDEAHSFITASWAADLSPGEFVEYSYVFDAPDISPYLYLLGPLRADGNYAFEELRRWQIASDAVGNMLLFWDNGGSVPAGWSCVSCNTSDMFYQRYPYGSSTYGFQGGTATHTHQFTTTVLPTNAAPDGDNDFSTQVHSEIGHTHPFTPNFAVGTNTPPTRTLRIIRSDNAGEPASIPAGAIMVFDVASSSLPSGWNRYTPLDGRFPMGENTPGTNSGFATHTHAISGTLTADNTGGADNDTGGTQVSTALLGHTHTLTATTTSVESSEPPYVEVLFAQLATASSAPQYGIAMWDNSPPTGWVTQSDSGRTFSEKFLKASTTYGTTGGVVDHTHPDVVGAVTGNSSSNANNRRRANPVVADNPHTHDVDFTSFSTDSILPKYATVIIAKRFSDIPFYTQTSYRFYVNTNNITPTDPWPAGTTDFVEDTPITTSADGIKDNERIRIRMNLEDRNATTTASMKAFKLQYVDSDDCPNALNWTDVAAAGAGGAPWRGYNNTSVSDGATLASLLLSTSTVLESYEEENNSAANPNQLTIGQVGEWDWVLESNDAKPGVLYCFRMVESDGTLLDLYSNHPQIRTNASTTAAVGTAPFQYEKVGTTTPSLKFYAVDPESNDVDYQVQVSLSATFTTTVIDTDSLDFPEYFENLTNSANKAPFYSGDLIQFRPQTPLSNNTTYWWRARGKDVGSNQWGDWSTAWSFTTDTAIGTSTWHQTTRDQFQLESTFDGANASGTDNIVVNVGSTTATAWSDEIDFDLRTTGTVWGSLSWNDTEPSGSILYRIEYFTSTSSWELIPDADLSGNGGGFSNSPVSLLGVDPTTYSKIRIRASLSVSTQSIQDWTVTWGYKVDTPTLYSPFDNAKVSTTTPSFEFETNEPLAGGDLVYQISWSTNSSFTSSTTRESNIHAGFQNLTTATDTSPFYEDERIRFTIQPGDALTSSSTYFWRVRARDPGGSNVWSFWSRTYSITVDESITVATWFQNVDGQWSTDALTSLYTTGTGTLYVATTTDEVLLVYGEGTVQTPRYRIWNGTTLGSELSALSVGGVIRWATTRASPLTGQYILGTLDGNRDVNFQVYEGGAWGNQMELTTSAPSVTRRSFDIAYETGSGAALAVACNGTPDPIYQVWDGSAWGATGTIDLPFSTNCEWIRLASDPTSDEIVGVFRDTAQDYQTHVWNGSAWAGPTTTLGAMTEADHEGMAVEYEASGNQAVVVTSSGNSNQFEWTAWDGSSWTAPAAVTSIGEDLEWANLRRNVGNDDMVLCYVENDSDQGAVRWTGAGWTGQIEWSNTNGPGKDGRKVDCIYEVTTGRTNYIMGTYSEGGNRYRVWDTATWLAEATVSGMGANNPDTHQMARSSFSGTILGLFFDYPNLYFSTTSPNTWGSAVSIENNMSVTALPFGEPFYMAARNPAQLGTVFSTAIDFDDGVSPAWDTVSWTRTINGLSSLSVQVQYQTASGTWALIPDSDLPGNSAGATTSPIDIRSLDSNTYNVIRLKGNLQCSSGSCPELHDWTVKWASGVALSGTAKAHDLTTNVTSGTVSVAVNGSLRAQTGTISGGNWSIQNVTVFPGDAVTVFVSGASDPNEAAAVFRYTGPGDSGGIRLFEQWLTIGSASTTNQIISLYDVSRYDNTAGGEDLFFDVDAGGDYSNCATGSCSNSGIYVVSDIFSPATSTSETITVFDLRIASSSQMTANTNTIKVGGDWTNNGSFFPNTSTVVFNATSSYRSITSTSLTSSSTFYHATFGESGSTATWQFGSAFVATGTVSMSFGTTSPGVNAVTLEGDFTIGASGNFHKGSATTTFSGSAARTWTDSSAAKQDLGKVLVDGTTKTITLGSSVRATDLTVGSDDTLSLGGSNTLFLMGNLVNNNAVTAVTGTLEFAATTTGHTINQGSSGLYNVLFSGAGGGWRWLNTNATITNNLSFTAGSTTLPAGALAIGGNMDANGGDWYHNSGALRFTSTASGKTIRFGARSGNEVYFAGSGGGWTFQDTNATTVGSVIWTAGTTVLPAGTFAVGGNFANQGGAFTAPQTASAIELYATSSRTIQVGTSQPHGLTFSGTTTYSFLDQNATTTGLLLFTRGTTTLPANALGLFGSLSTQGSAAFIAASTTGLTATTGARTIDPRTSSFEGLLVNSTGGSITISANATATAHMTLRAAAAFTQSSGTTLAVGGVFENVVGGGATTWTGSTLKLYSGTEYSVNTKTTGADAYGTLNLSGGTKIRSWNSSASSYIVPASSFLYSQDHNAVDGSLYIFGGYIRTTGTDHWSAATDFDGTSLSGSERAVAVRFDSGATAFFGTSTTLNVVGTSTATTTIDRQSSGSFGIEVQSGTLNADFYQFRNMNLEGLKLSGATAITAFDDGAFYVDTTGASAITVASTTVAANAQDQYFRVRFSLGAALGGFNVLLNGTTGSTTQFIRFKQHYGGLDGESFDADGFNPGDVRWDDSSFIVTISGTVFSDAGATEMTAPVCDGITPVVSVKVNGQGSFTAPCMPGPAATGTYSVAGVTFQGDPVITVYLNTNGGANAVLVTKTVSADLTGINLYQDRVIVRHEDVSPISIAEMNAFDSAQDSDIPYLAATTGPNTLSVEPETEFWIWSGKTFVPGGNITLNSGGSGNTWDGTFHIDNNATFTGQGAEAHSVGGRFVADSGATFTSASTTFTFTATTSGKVVTGLAPLTFWKMVMNGTGGVWSINQDVTVLDDLTMTAGTMIGAANVAVEGDNVTGAGTIAMTGGNFTFVNGGMFGGVPDWRFNRLTFGGGSFGTTTKTASSSIALSGVLTVSANHELRAGTSTIWSLEAAGIPFVRSGTFDPERSTVRYSATSTATITATQASYWNVQFSASSTGAPSYALQAGTWDIANHLTIGNASSTITANANTNDPVITVSGNVLVTGTSTFIASNLATTTARRDWTNAGTFQGSGGIVHFDATTTGFTVLNGASPFSRVRFEGTHGGWTIPAHATSTDLTLAGGTLTVSPGVVLEVDGIFTNQTGGASTTWTGSTLYLYGSTTPHSINAKTTGADAYGNLQVGANTDVRMWNSTSTTIIVHSTGSLYSQDHDASDGVLRIYGEYIRSSGDDFWSYGTDFDGTALGGSSRLVSVLVASSSSVALSGGSLEVLGVSTASTTVAVLGGTGAFSFSVSGGSTTMRHMVLRNTDQSGLSFTGSPTVSTLSESDFELSRASGTMITVAGSVITANPLRIFFKNRFATTTGIATGANVTATGVTGSAWKFTEHYGNYASEQFDMDPGGDPGYIIWDDSAAQIVISGNVYADEGQTPIGNPVCNGVTQNVRLRVQGAGNYTSACDNSTGAFSISNIAYNPGDTLSLYLDTGASTTAANISVDPATNISDMHLFQNFTILRHEQGNPLSIAAMNQYDSGNDPDMPFLVTVAATNTLSVRAGTGLIVWTSKVFAPVGEVTTHANASADYRDGTVKLYATSTWSAATTQIHTIGGNFLAASGASVAPANSSFVFAATTTGKGLLATSSLTFYDLSFTGAGGGWDISGVGTTSNDLLISAGTLTFPSGTLAVGGTFNNSGGTWYHNSGTLKFTSTASGESVRFGGSTAYDVLFNGAGGTWTFADTNATTAGSVTILAGTPTLPLGTLAVGRDFVNQGGSFSAPGTWGTLKMTATSTGRIVRFGGSQLNHLTVENAGEFSIPEANATATGNIILKNGTTTFATSSFATYGSFANQGVFVAASTTQFVSTTTGRTIDPGGSPFEGLTVNGTGGFTIPVNATATRNVRLAAAGQFTLSSGATLAVSGEFTNSAGGGGTTWTGSTLKLSSGTEYSVNTKSAGGDGYGTIQTTNGTKLRMWNSSSTSYALDPSAFVYSQDHNGTDGALNIYGRYVRDNGTDHWSYATDFDGTALGGSSRQVNVRFAASASAYFATGTTLQMLGSAAASTTLDRQSSGNYGIEIQAATLNANYYQIRNTDLDGLKLTGTTTITALSNGDLELGINGGSLMTIASTTIDQNASAQYFSIRFATSSGISGANVTRLGTTTNAITFGSEYGNYASEAYDNDGNDACGSIRFTDSSCLFSDQRNFRWRYDDGGEGVPASEWYNASWSKRKRVRVVNNSSSALTNAAVRLWVTYDSDMQTDFDDLRFTDSNGITPISSWLETYSASASSSVWVKVPSISAGGTADIFMYYGNGSATASSTGTTTFTFFDDFEDGSISEYSGDTSLFEASNSFNYERNYGLDASTGNEAAQNTDGIGRATLGIGRDTRFRFFQYIDMTTGGSNEPCFLFGMQSPITNNQNYGVCLSPFGADEVTIVENAAYNGRNDGSTQLSTKTVTYSTGWYEVFVDWISSGNQINVSVYDSGGSLFATTSATDSTYTSGGIGFTFWGQHGGWDIPMAYPYIATTSPPTVTFGIEQGNSGATWKSAENTALTNQLANQNVRLRLTIRNTGTTLSNQNFRLQVAPKGGSANCESVSSGSYVDVPTTTGGCGSSAACMKTTTQYSDRASSTQLLSIPSNMTFTYGQTLEDPSNETGNVTLQSGEFTEVEYNIQMTSFATQDAYCLRSTKAGTALDNYTKVAEVRMLHAPSITDWFFNMNSHIGLIEGTTTRIFATGTVTDFNGYADLKNASSTFYRSAVSGGNSCAADPNNCYQIATTSCSFESCSGNSCTLSCYADMWFIAEPTDAGSIFEAQDWRAFVDVWDFGENHDTDSHAREVNTLRGIDIPAAIDYGSLVVGTDTGAAPTTTLVENTGNTILDVLLSGSNMTAGASNIVPEQQKYATSTFTYSSCVICSLLSTTTTAYDLNVDKPTTTTPYGKFIFWGLNVPLGTAATGHTGVNTFLAN